MCIIVQRIVQGVTWCKVKQSAEVHAQSPGQVIAPTGGWAVYTGNCWAGEHADIFGHFWGTKPQPTHTQIWKHKHITSIDTYTYTWKICIHSMNKQTNNVGKCTAGSRMCMSHHGRTWCTICKSGQNYAGSVRSGARIWLNFAKNK